MELDINNQDEYIDFEQLKPKAENGEPHAQFLLAYLYLTEKRDKETALEWFLKAAKGGDAEAQASVAAFYEIGYVVEKNLGTAEIWLRNAASNGSVGAMARLSRLISSKDPKEAMKLAKYAADKGDIEAYKLLGYYYWHGVAGSVDISKAAEWYKKAADKGDKKALNFYQELISEHREDISELLPEIPNDVPPNVVSEDFEVVKHELYLACKRGDVEAESLLEKVEKHEHSRAKIAYYCPGMAGDNRISERPLFVAKPTCPTREYGKSLTMNIAGVMHNDYNFCKSIVEGYTCYEPNNEHDPNAVALIANNGHKLGYIPRKKQCLYESTFFGDKVCFVAFLMGSSDRVILFTQDNRKAIWSEYKRLLCEYLHAHHTHELYDYNDWIEFQTKYNKNKQLTTLP